MRTLFDQLAQDAMFDAAISRLSERNPMSEEALVDGAVNNAHAIAKDRNTF
jgi:hypothetical protein